MISSARDELPLRCSIYMDPCCYVILDYKLDFGQLLFACPNRYSSTFEMPNLVDTLAYSVHSFRSCPSPPAHYNATMAHRQLTWDALNEIVGNKMPNNGPFRQFLVSEIIVIG